MQRVTCPTTIRKRKAGTSTRAPRRERSKRELYYPPLLKFMSWRDGVDYPKDSEFTMEQKAIITPEQLVRWMKHRIYDDAEADPDIDRPKLRSSTILFWKKAISHFMPNKRTDWNELANVGNPTRSKPVVHHPQLRNVQI
jgi:hypothetical protein